MISLGVMKNTPIIIGDLHNPRIQNLHEPMGFKVRKSEMESPRSQKTTTVWMGDAATKDLTGSTGISLGA